MTFSSPLLRSKQQPLQQVPECPPVPVIGRFDVLLCQNVGKQRPTWHEGFLTISAEVATLYSCGDIPKKGRNLPSTGERRFVCSARQRSAMPSEASDQSPSSLFLRMLEHGFAVGAEFSLNSTVAVQITSIKDHPIVTPHAAKPNHCEGDPIPTKMRRVQGNLHCTSTVKASCGTTIQQATSPLPTEAAMTKKCPEQMPYLTAFFAAQGLIAKTSSKPPQLQIPTFQTKPQDNDIKRDCNIKLPAIVSEKGIPPLSMSDVLDMWTNKSL